MDVESVPPSESKPVEIAGGLILTAAVALRLAGVAPISTAATGMTFLSAIIVLCLVQKRLQNYEVSPPLRDIILVTSSRRLRRWRSRVRTVEKPSKDPSRHEL